MQEKPKYYTSYSRCPITGLPPASAPKQTPLEVKIFKTDSKSTKTKIGR